MRGHLAELGLGQVAQHEGRDLFQDRAIDGAHRITTISVGLASDFAEEQVESTDIRVTEGGLLL